MGGAIALTLASTLEYKDLTSQIRGFMLESPYIALHPDNAPNAITVFAGKLAGKLLPHMQIVNVMPAETIVRDPLVQKSLTDDPLCHNTGTLEMFAAMLDRAASLDAGKYVLNPGVQAIYIAHGNGDRSTSYDASKKYYERCTKGVTDKAMKTYEGWSHQLHADLPGNGEIYATDCAEWILKRVGGETKL
jgi:acylglycerol lipase